MVQTDQAFLLHVATASYPSPSTFESLVIMHQSSPESSQGHTVVGMCPLQPEVPQWCQFPMVPHCSPSATVQHSVSEQKPLLHHGVGF